MKKPTLIICVLLVAVHDIHPQQNGFPKLTGPYLGQKQPGMTPEPFAGNISEVHTVLHSGIVFSPDGTEAYWFAEGSPGLDVRLLNGAAVITSVKPESPASQSGLRPGYVIQASDGVSVDEIVREAELWTSPPHNRRGRIDRITKSILARIYGTPGTEVAIVYSGICTPSFRY